MKIIDNRPKDKMTKLYDIHNGDTFIFNEKLYLMLDEEQADCFCLTNNTVCAFDSCDPLIEKVECSIVIEKE